jgi:hypothetical protein
MEIKIHKGEENAVGRKEGKDKKVTRGMKGIFGRYSNHHHHHKNNNIIIAVIQLVTNLWGRALVEALCYKLDGRGFDSS